MRYLHGVIEDFNPDKAATKFTNLQKALSQINNVGDTLEADLYESLGAAAQKYFVRMGDGTYKLIKSAEEFKDAAERAHTAALKA
jgi:hypothetical protein